MTAPTSGFGDAWPHPRAASSSAPSIRSRSTVSSPSRNDYLAGPRSHFTHRPSHGAGYPRVPDDLVGGIARGNHDHPDAHVEHAEHLVARYVAGLTEHVEHGRDLPGGRIHHGVEIRRKRAVEISRTSPARDVSHRVGSVEHRRKRAEIRAVYCKHHVSDR